MAGAALENHDKFLCDEMLKKLAHWLRAAGYDTALATEGENDRYLLEKAINEKRWLITRDRKLTELRHASTAVILLHSNDMYDCAKELQKIFSLNWLIRPFTRCMLCNTPLILADPVLLKKVPAQSRASVNQLFQCTHCNKLYWEGSHVRRLRTMFQQWMQN